MGIDGRQYLEVRGPMEDITLLRETMGIIDGSDEIKEIAERFFGDNASIHHDSKNCIIFVYDFRNLPTYIYLEQLLKTYPRCWFKNELRTELGACGLWIGRMCGGIPEIQELDWRELSDQEIFCPEHLDHRAFEMPGSLT